MKTWRYLLSVGVLGVSLSALAQVNLRPEVARVLQSAQEAIQAKHPDAALDSLQALRTQGDLSEPERLLLERLTVVAAMNAQKFELAGNALDTLLQNQTLTPADRLTLTESRINVALRLKNQEQIALWAQRYIALGGSNPKVYPVLLQSLAAQQKFKEVLAAREQHRQNTDAAAKPDEVELRLYAQSYSQLGDKANLAATLGELVRFYPSTATWSDLLNTLGRNPQLNARQQLEISRLMEQTHTLADAEDYLDMAGFAFKSGLPDESLRLLAQAQAANLFDTANRQKAAAQLKTQAQQRASEDEKELRRLANDANGTQQRAEVSFSKGEWKQAATLYTQALQQGATRREAETRLHLGIALLRDQQTDAARQAFAAVKGDVFAQNLADLWLLLTP